MRIRDWSSDVCSSDLLSAQPQALGDGRFDAAIRHGLGEWRGLRSVRLFPILFMPLCAHALREAAAGLENPDTPTAVQLLGRPAWWNPWSRALGVAAGPAGGGLGRRQAAQQQGTPPGGGRPGNPPGAPP